MKSLILIFLVISTFSFANEEKKSKELSNLIKKEDLSTKEKKKEKLQKEIAKLMSMISKE